MSVDILRDSANTRSQRRRNLKGEGAQTVKIVRQATTTQNQIKLIWLYREIFLSDAHTRKKYRVLQEVYGDQIQSSYTHDDFDLSAHSYIRNITQYLFYDKSLS